MPSVSEQAAAWSAELDFAVIPAEVVAGQRWRILDTLGVALASSAQDYGQRMRAGTLALGWARPRPYPRLCRLDFGAGASLANGAMASAQSFDDTHNATIVHVTASVLAAGLALGEETRRLGRGFSGGDHRRQRTRLPHRPSRAAAIPQARLASDRDFRRGRRDLRRLPAAEARSGQDRAGRRYRRQFRRRDRRRHARGRGIAQSPCRLGSAIRHHGGIAGARRPYRPATGLRGAGRAVPGACAGSGLRFRFRRRARGLGQALGMPDDLAEALSLRPCAAFLHRRDPGAARRRICARAM